MLFFTLTTSFHILLLCFYFSSILLAKFFSNRIDNGDEEEDECIDKEDWESAGDGSQSNLHEEDLGFITFECTKNGYLVPNIISSEEAQLVSSIQISHKNHQSSHEESLEELVKESFSHYTTPTRDEDSNEEDEDEGSDSVKNLEEDENFYSLSPTKLDSHNTKTLQDQDQDQEKDSFTISSTSMSEDPFSSSSRRSCPTWESYTAFQKYDEEMTFYDQIAAQKLNETKLQKGVEVLQRSMSQKIVQKFSRSKRSSRFERSPYHELETAYVAQVCLAWEALSLNYKNFVCLRSLQCEDDPGCPSHIAQQFQQFQVLLQRFIENEPYEHGRRPEVYARIRVSSPKLLQVPEFKGIGEKEKVEEEAWKWNANISSFKFTTILESGIQTFMHFLKADRGDKHCMLFKALITRNNKNFISDPTLHFLLKKTNKRKRRRLRTSGEFENA